MRAKLYGVPGSHPVLSAELMLAYKGIPYSRFDLPNMSHKFILPLLRFRGSTVPVMKLDGRRVTSTMRIARALDKLQPDPPLFPPQGAAAVEGAEAWADSVLQDTVRQLGRWGATHDPDAMGTFLETARMGVPTGVVRRALPLLRPVVALQMNVSDETARACLAALPGQLDRVDALLAEGVIGGEHPNAADFQIAPCVRLAMCFDQLRDGIASRPAGGHAMRVCPNFPGRFTAVLPEAWL
jgi:glutathione S-transferase